MKKFTKKEIAERLAVIQTAIRFFEELKKVTETETCGGMDVEILLSPKMWHSLAEHLIKLDEDGLRTTEFGHEAMLTGRTFPIAHGWNVLFKEKD